jgi:hypothetical protein
LARVCSDLVPLQILRLGDQKKLLLAVRALRTQTVGLATPSLADATTLPPSSSPSSSSSAPAAICTPPATSSGRLLPLEPFCQKKSRRPRHCRRCHHFRQGNHNCGEKDACTSWLSCPTQYLAGHPEVKKREGQEAKKRKREAQEMEQAEAKRRKAEEKQLKRRVSELLKTEPCPNFDAYFATELANLAKSEPQRYSMDKDTPQFLAASRLIKQEWSQLHMRKAAERRLKGSLRKRKKELSLSEQLEFLERGLASLDSENDTNLVSLQHHQSTD